MRQRCFFHVYGLVAVLSCLAQAHPSNRNNGAVASSSGSASTCSQQDSTAQQSRQSQQVVQLLETEMYSNNTWMGTLPSRWSTMDGDESIPPPFIIAPLGYEFVGDWKIITSPTRDQLGWEYVWDEAKPAMRRRIWLRTLSLQKADHDEISTTTTPLPSRALTTTTKTAQKATLLRSVRDDWNFKGFGWSFYKSLLYLQSCGICFRVPLSMNFDWCERHPAVPAVTSSIEVYFPWTVAIFLNASLNVDWIKWTMRLAVSHMHRLLMVVCFAVVRAVLLLVSLPLYPLTRRVAKPQWSLPKPSHPSPQYGLNIQERVGMSVSWRVSQKRGYEYRVSYWHSYFPSILYLHSLWQRAAEQLLTTQRKGNRHLEDKKPNSLEDWMRRRTGSLGLSTAAPIPDSPFYSCNACLNLGGFRYHEKKRKTKRTSKVSSLEETKEQLAKMFTQEAVLLRPSSLRNEGTNSNSTSYNTSVKLGR